MEIDASHDGLSWCSVLTVSMCPCYPPSVNRIDEVSLQQVSYCDVDAGD